MKKLEFEDIKNIYEYERIRKEFKSKLIPEKKIRRLPVGNLITLIFENRDTVKLQIQEMMRVERMVNDKMIQHEIDTYNLLIPDKNQLKATMMIEITEKNHIKPILDSLVGLTKNSLSLEFAGQKIFPAFDDDQFDNDRISAVQYLTFDFTEEQKNLFIKDDTEVIIKIKHKNYQAENKFSPELKKVLSQEIQN